MPVKEKLFGARVVRVTGIEVKSHKIFQNDARVSKCLQRKRNFRDVFGDEMLPGALVKQVPLRTAAGEPHRKESSQD